MHASDFDMVLKAQIAATKRVLGNKGGEYATEGDRLSNFKTAAKLQNCKPRQALGGMLAKHIVSVFDMIDEPEPRPFEVWDEKITDSINYLILLRGLVVDEMNEKTGENRKQSASDKALAELRKHLTAPAN